MCAWWLYNNTESVFCLAHGRTSGWHGTTFTNTPSSGGSSSSSKTVDSVQRVYFKVHAHVPIGDDVVCCLGSMETQCTVGCDAIKTTGATSSLETRNAPRDAAEILLFKMNDESLAPLLPNPYVSIRSERADWCMAVCIWIWAFPSKNELQHFNYQAV